MSEHRDLSSAHRAEVARTAAALDVEGGLDDVLRRARHSDAVAATAGRLDVERGLRAALDHATAVPRLRRDRRAGATPWPRLLSDRFDSLPAYRRLALRAGGDVVGRREALVRALDLCSDFAAASSSAQELAGLVDRALGDRAATGAALEAARHLVARLDLLRDLVHDEVLHLSSRHDRSRRIDLGRGLDVATDLVADVANGLDPRSATGAARARDAAHDLDRGLRRDALREIVDVVARAHADRLGRRLGWDGPCTGAPADAGSFAVLQRALDRATNDFLDADLTSTSLDGVVLAGIRWSIATRWSDRWESVVRDRSVEVEPGVYEIRDDSPERRGTEVPG